jgi:hypothetical protein
VRAPEQALLQLQRTAGNQAVRQLIQRAVGYEFQVIASQVPDNEALPKDAKLPIKLKGWELQNDSGNLEFVVKETNDLAESKQRVTAAKEVAEKFAQGAAIVKGGALSPRAAGSLEAVRARSKVTKGDAQPQINADIRIDQIEKFFATYADKDLLDRERHGGDPTVQDPELFRNRSTFSSWKKTRGELTESALTWIDPPQKVLEKMVAPEKPAERPVHVAMLRGLMRLMFQYLVHGKKQHMPPPDFMKDLPALSKSNMGLAAKQIAFAKDYLDDEGARVDSVTNMITDLLTVMTGRGREEFVFSTITDGPRITQWVETIVLRGDDPLASLEEGQGKGKPFGSQRETYPTSLGGLGLGKGSEAHKRASDPLQTAKIPELVVEMRRLPEIPPEQWVTFGEKWFKVFEGLRARQSIPDVDPLANVAAAKPDIYQSVSGEKVPK